MNPARPLLGGSPWLLGYVAPWRSHPSPSQVCQISERTQQVCQIRPDRQPRAPACYECVEAAQNEARIPSPRSSIYNIIRTLPRPSD